MKDKKYPLYTAKIKVIEKRWHGWSPEGMKIPPKEDVYEKPSGSFLVVSKITHKMTGVWGEKDQSADSMKRVDYQQKEGFRIFISWKLPNVVTFTPIRTLKPISGKIFPVQSDLPLKEERLKIGDSFIIKPDTRDAGVSIEITLLDIYADKKG